jgi:hypothetical protein
MQTMEEKRMVTPLSDSARRLYAPALLSILLAWPGRTQQPVPAPTPPPTPAPAPTEQGTPPAGENRPQGPERQGPERRGGRRGPGREQQSQELPEFTPVAAPSPLGLLGKQYFWFTMYPDLLVQFDPVTDTITKKVKLQHGMFWSSTLTQDRKRLLIVTDQQQSIEVVDLAEGTVLATHPFKEDTVTVRIRDVRECPGGVHWFVRVERVKKEIDRYSFEPSQWLLYDSANKKVVRKTPRLPDPIERNAQLSADGGSWITQDDDGNVLFLDGRKFNETGRIDLRTPRFFGAGALRLTGTDLLDRRDPNRALMLFTSQDPVEKSRTGWGMVELDLQKKLVVDVQEWGPQVGAFGMRVAPKKLVAAAMTGNFGGGGGGGERDNKSRLLLYDLKNGQKLAEGYEEFRPRRSLVAISPDADKIYIGTAGSDFEVFDAQCKRMKTVELEGEISGRIYVIDG